MTATFSPKQIAILKELKEEYLKFGKGAETCPIFGYRNFYWHELTELAEISPYVIYTPPNPKGNPMYETGKHSIAAAIVGWDAPAKPSRKRGYGVLTQAAKRALPEKRLPYQKAMAIRFYRKLLAKGKAPQPIFNETCLPVAKQISSQEFKANCYLEDIREKANRLGQWEIDMMADSILKPKKNFYSFKDRQQYHLAFRCNWSLELSRMSDKKLASEESASEWQQLWEQERKEFLEDLEAYRLKLNPPAPTVEDTLCIGRYDVSTLLAVLKDAKKHAAKLPKGFVKGFDDKQVRLIHIRNIGTEIEFLAGDELSIAPEERFIVYGSNRGTLPGFQISLALEQLHNTAQYPGILDLDRDGKVMLEINFTRNLLTVIGIETRYRVNLTLISSEHREELEDA